MDVRSTRARGLAKVPLHAIRVLTAKKIPELREGSRKALGDRMKPPWTHGHLDVDGDDSAR